MSRWDRRGIAALTALSGAAMVTWMAAPAGATSSGAAMNVNVVGSSETMGSCTPGPSSVCSWTVTSDVTVVNLTSGTLAYQQVTPKVDWQDSTNGTSGVVTSVTTTAAGTPALQSGDTLGPGAQQAYNGYQVSFQIPKGATDGDLAIAITTNQGTGSGDSQFLAGGQPLPLGAVGGLAAAGVTGGGLAVASRRRRARRRQAAASA